MPWALLLPLITSVFSKDGPIGQYFTTKAQIQQQTLNNDLAIKQAQLKLAEVQAQATVDSENNKLKATGQGFKFVSYVLLTMPILIVCIAPARGKDIFDNLALIPVWYAQLYVAVVGVIWGLPIAASAVSGIFSAIQEAWADRQDKKIEKIQAIGKSESLGLEQAKKQIYDTLRSVNGAVSQSQVDAINPVLDKILPALAGNNNTVTTTTTDSN